MQCFEVHSNESVCRKSGRIGLKQVNRLIKGEQISILCCIWIRLYIMLKILASSSSEKLWSWRWPAPCSSVLSICIKSSIVAFTSRSLIHLSTFAFYSLSLSAFTSFSDRFIEWASARSASACRFRAKASTYSREINALNYAPKKRLIRSSLP